MDHPWRHNGRRQRPLEDRFWEKVDKSAGPDKCWPWIGARNNQGRGIIQVSRRATYATRALFDILGQPLGPADMACHRCDNVSCVNPAHLFVGDQAVNMADMVAKGRSSRRPKTAEHRARIGEANRRYYAEHPDAHPERRKTHCPRGHPYSGANLRILKNGRRRCVTCDRDLWRAWYWRRRHGVVPVPPRQDGPRTTCRRGHPLSGDNLYLWRGVRYCMTCRRAAQARRRR